MLSHQHVKQYNEAIVTEVQELKRRIDEIKRSNISNKNSLLLQALDIQLSEKLKNYALQIN